MTVPRRPFQQPGGIEKTVEGGRRVTKQRQFLLEEDIDAAKKHRDLLRPGQRRFIQNQGQVKGRDRDLMAHPLQLARQRIVAHAGATVIAPGSGSEENHVHDLLPRDGTMALMRHPTPCATPPPLEVASRRPRRDQPVPPERPDSCREANPRGVGDPTSNRRSSEDPEDVRVERLAEPLHQRRPFAPLTVRGRLTAYSGFTTGLGPARNAKTVPLSPPTTSWRPPKAGDATSDSPRSRLHSSVPASRLAA